jgi:hypothetical protein
MQDLIEDELRAVLASWNAGNEVASIPLGHSTHVDGVDQSGNPREVHHVFRQRKALGYAFQLIASGLVAGLPMLFDQFYLLCLEERENTGIKTVLSRYEIEAAESLAWKALLRGWKRAIAGFPESSYISVAKAKAKPEEKSAA